MSAKWDSTLADLNNLVAAADPAAARERALDEAADMLAVHTTQLRQQLGDLAPPIPG